jgi:predicted ATP-grasp superfamily ATP-dependent carboligase
MRPAGTDAATDADAGDAVRGVPRARLTRAARGATIEPETGSASHVSVSLAREMSGLAAERPSRRVLVTDARERSALATIRALAGAGYDVSAAGVERLSPGRASRFCRGHHRVPSPAADGAAFVHRLREIVDRGAYDALILGSDASLLAVSDHRELLGERVKVGLPPRDAVRRALSKLELARAAESSGFRAPPMIPCESADEAHAAARELGFPVVAKSASAVVVGEDGRITRPDTRLIRDSAELSKWLDLQRPGLALIQAREHGPVYSCAGVLAGEDMVGFLLARYLRTWPTEAGNASFERTVSPPEGLRERITRLLGQIGWQGIFEVELMGTDDGDFTPIDLNPRVYGSLALAVRAGAVFPALWCDVLLGRPVTPQVARPGVSYRWEEGELRNLVALARGGSLRGVLALLRPQRPCAHADFSLSDPGPAAARALLIARRTLSARPRARAEREAELQAASSATLTRSDP